MSCSNPECGLVASNVSCTNCKIKYCSAKCKKANKKHRCTFIPAVAPVLKEPTADVIPIRTERRQYMMYLEHRLQKIIYPDGTDVSISFIESGGSVIPCMKDSRATYLLGTLYERCKDKIQICAGKGYLLAVYNDYVELARAYADDVITNIKWVDDADGEPNVVKTLEKNGRSNGILFGRLIIGTYLRTCLRLTLDSK